MKDKKIYLIEEGTVEFFTIQVIQKQDTTEEIETELKTVLQLTVILQIINILKRLEIILER